MTETPDNAYAISVAKWGRREFDISPPTAYRIVNSDDPPPMIEINGRQLVAIGSPKYPAWLDRRTSAA